MRLFERLCRTREFCRGHGGDAYYASLLLRNAISHRELAQKPSVGVETHNMRLFERRCRTESSFAGDDEETHIMRLYGYAMSYHTESFIKETVRRCRDA